MGGVVVLLVVIVLVLWVERYCRRCTASRKLGNTVSGKRNGSS